MRITVTADSAAAISHAVTAIQADNRTHSASALSAKTRNQFGNFCGHLTAHSRHPELARKSEDGAVLVVEQRYKLPT